MAPQSKGAKKHSKKKLLRWLLNTQKVHFMFFFAIKVPVICRTSDGPLIAL
jgi:hypothetical protein